METQFWKYGENDQNYGAESVLHALQNLKNNPYLLQYVQMRLTSNRLGIQEYFHIVVHKRHHLPLGGDKTIDIVYPAVFESREKAYEFAQKAVSISNEMLYEPYSVVPLNPSAI